MAYLNLTIDQELLKIETKDGQLKKKQYKTKKHDFEKYLKSLKIDLDYYKKKYKGLKKKKVFQLSSNFWLDPVQQNHQVDYNYWIQA